MGEREKEKGGDAAGGRVVREGEGRRNAGVSMTPRVENTLGKICLPKIRKEVTRRIHSNSLACEDIDIFIFVDATMAANMLTRKRPSCFY